MWRQALIAPAIVCAFFHDGGAIERVQVEQDERKFGRRQHGALDAAPRADEERLDRRVGADESARDRDARIEMATGAATRENHPWHGDYAGTGAAASGSVADSPSTRSRELPMFTRMPVNSIVSTRFDRP